VEYSQAGHYSLSSIIAVHPEVVTPVTRVVVDLSAALVRMAGTKLEGGRFGPSQAARPTDHRRQAG